MKMVAILFLGILAVGCALVGYIAWQSSLNRDERGQVVSYVVLVALLAIGVLGMVL